MFYIKGIWKVLVEEWKEPKSAILSFIWGIISAFFFFLGIQALFFQMTTCNVFDDQYNLELEEVPYHVGVWYWNQWVEEYNANPETVKSKTMYCNMNVLGFKI